LGRIEGKIALVTGGANGIGKAICELFTKEGAHVFLTDINEKEGKKVASALQGGGKKADFIKQDVQDEKKWASVIDTILKKTGHLDILVNNAGVIGLDLGPQNPEEASLDTWKLVHSINLDGTFLGCKYGIKAMKKSGGSIINMSSRSGIVGIPGAAAYASSKAAVRNHTKTVALYCADHSYNIRCNSLHPAAIMTPLWDLCLGAAKDHEKRLKEAEHAIPLRHFGKPIDVAYAALYLASDESSYLTGSEITIDGGVLAGAVASPAKD